MAPPSGHPLPLKRRAKLFTFVLICADFLICTLSPKRLFLCTFPQLLYPLSHGLSAEKDEEHRSRSHNEHDKAGKLSRMSRMSEPHCSQSCHAAYHPLGKRLYAVAQPVEPHLRLTAYNDYSCDIAYHVAGIIGYKLSLIHI